MQLRQLKPAASRRVHLLAAALLWSGVGAALLVCGLLWAGRRSAPGGPLLIAVALGTGLVKSRVVLDAAAKRIAARIAARGDGRCLGGFLSVSSWLFVLGMSLGGRMARSHVTWRAWLGLVYVAVGSAMLLSVRLLWLAWRRSERLQG